MEKMEWVRHLSPPDAREPVAPASSKASIDSATAAIGAGPVGWAVSATAQIVAAVAQDLEGQMERAPVTGYEREACEACLLASLASLVLGSPVHTPVEAINQVRMSVRQGIPIAGVLRTVWASHTMVQDALLGEASRLLPTERIVAAIRVLNDRLSEIVNVYVRELMAEYEEELAVWRGDLTGDRCAVLDSLLEGVEPPGAERILGLRMDGWHLLAVLWQGSHGFVSDADGDVGRFVAGATRLLGASGALVLPRGSETVVWWTFRTAPSESPADLLEKLPGPEWVRLGVGELGRAVPGVRSSHTGAELARLTALRLPQPSHRRAGTQAVGPGVLAYERIRVATLALGEEAAAQQFVRSVLAGALGTDARSNDYRTAAQMYLASGFSRHRAAEQLNVAPNTIAHRVGRLGELLGRTVQENPTETLIALELVAQAPWLL